MSFPTQNLPQNSCHHDLGRRKLLIPLGSMLSKIYFPTSRRGWNNMISFIKIQSENMKMTWNIRISKFCMICNFFKCDGVTVLKIISIIYYGINFIASPLQP